MPPEAEDFAGTSAKERVADVMISLWRPLRTDLTKNELREMVKTVRAGGATEDKIYQLHTMGVRCVKDRLGEAPGKQCMVAVNQGDVLSDDPAPAYHGIRTNREF